VTSISSIYLLVRKSLKTHFGSCRTIFDRTAVSTLF